jgi:hypothetical protein
MVGAPMSNDKGSSTAYGVRFEFLVSTYLDVDSDHLDFEMAGQPMVLKAVHDELIKDASEVTIGARGFCTETEAREFGDRLQKATTLAATKTGLGIDVGMNQTRSSVSKSIRDRIYQEHGRVLRDRIHGVDVFAAEEPVHTLVVRAFGTVRIQPRTFLDELEASYLAWPDTVSERLTNALRIHSQANQMADNLSRMLLGIAAVEVLASDEDWSEKQRELLRSFEVNALNYPDASETEVEEVISQLRNLRKLSVGEGFRRLLRRLRCEAIWPEWRKVYHARSRILHGDMPREEVVATIGETMKLSRMIILTAAALEIPGADSNLA